MKLPRSRPAGVLGPLALGGCVLMAGACDSSPTRVTIDSPQPSPTTPPGVPELRINEVMTSNSATLDDEFGESSDWIELYNGGQAPVNLGGYGLTDDPDSLYKWTFGDVTIGPGEYLLVFASGTDVRTLDQVPPPTWQGIREYVWSWADSQNDPPGGSRVDPVLFPGEVTGLYQGRRVISADLYLTDNEPALTWSAAVVYMGFVSWDATASHDFSGYNQAFIQMTLAAGAQLEVLFCQPNIECWTGYSHTITGNGIEDYQYEIPIDGNRGGLDLSILTGIELRAIALNQTTNILVTDFIFSHTGYYLHTNFRVSSSGETVVLSDPSGTILDSKAVPALPSDVSLGRDFDSPGDWVVFGEATPAAPNTTPAYSAVSAGPIFGSDPGLYASPFTLSLSTPTNGAVYYTTDGSLPTRDSVLHTEPIAIDQTTVVRAVGASEGMLDSEPVSHTYFVGANHSIPIISISTDPAYLFDPDTGIYVMGPGASPEFPHHGANFWLEIEVPAYVEFYEPDGSLGFETGVGLRIFGNWSRGHDMKSLSLHFRGEYGLTLLEYPVFPDHPELRQFESLVLRNGGNDFGHSMIRDAMASSLTEGMGISYQKYRPSVVYLNGEYWGLHNIREKLNEDYFLTNFGLTEDEFDLLRAWGEIQAGTSDRYDAMIAYMETHGAAADADYAHIQTQMDVDSFIDYFCTEFYLTNQDWPGNNIKWWRPYTPADSKWKWVLYDLDFAFRYPEEDMISFATELNDEWPNPEWSTFLLRTLLQNSEFTTRFINRCAVWLSLNFRPSRVLARVDEMADAIRSEIPRFFQRWDLNQSEWQRSIDDLKEFPPLRPGNMRQNFVSYFGLGGIYTLTLQASGGEILVEGVAVPGDVYTGELFVGNPVTLTAVPEPGRSFTGWSDGEPAPQRTINPSGDLQLTAQFN